FSMAVAGDRSPAPCIGGRGGKLAVPARPIALDAYFCQENCPLVNYPNETMSTLPHCQPLGNERQKAVTDAETSRHKYRHFGLPQLVIEAFHVLVLQGVPA